MSVAMMIDNPAGSRELYERILDSVGGDLPLGGVLHLAGPSPHGGWRVIEVFGSEDAGRRFVAERFAPAYRVSGATAAPPAPEFWPVQVVETLERTAARGGAR